MRCTPAMLLMLTMRERPGASSGAAARQTRAAPKKLVSSVASASSAPKVSPL